MSTPDFMPIISKGAHKTPQDGACIMEYASILAGEKFDDTPSCTASEIATTAALVNDSVSDEGRQRLLALLPRIMNTSDESFEEGWALMKYRQEWMRKLIADINPAITGKSIWHFKQYTMHMTDDDLIAGLVGILDLYDELTGRQPEQYAEVTDADFEFLRKATTV